MVEQHVRNNVMVYFLRLRKKSGFLLRVCFFSLISALIYGYKVEAIILLISWLLNNQVSINGSDHFDPLIDWILAHLDCKYHVSKLCEVITSFILILRTMNLQWIPKFHQLYVFLLICKRFFVQRWLLFQLLFGCKIFFCLNTMHLNRVDPINKHTFISVAV